MALVQHIFILFLQCTWSLYKEIGDFTNDGAYQSELIKARCKARCSDKYGRKPIQRSQDTFYNVYESNECEGFKCRKCMVPCGIMSKTTSKSCKEACVNHDDVCMSSCSLIVRNQNFTEDKIDNGINVTAPEVICQQVKNNTTVSLSLNLNVEMVNDISIVFVVSVLHGLNSSIWKTLGQIKRSVVQINNLGFNTYYMFRVTVVGKDGIIGPSKNSEWIRTMKATSSFSPLKDIEIAGQTVHNGRISALVKWDSGTDPPCYFILHWMTDNPRHFDHESDTLEEPPMPKYWINQLHFGSNYKLIFSSYGTSDFKKNSSNIETRFTTAECLEATHYNYSLCAPDEPKNVTVNIAQTVENSSCTVNVSWFPPLNADSRNQMLSYLVTWHKIIPIHLSKYIEPHHVVQEVDGVTRQIEIKDINWNYNYSITIQAVSSKGNSKAVILFLSQEECQQPDTSNYSELEEEKSHLNLIFGGSLGILLIIIVISSSIVLIIKYKKTTKYSTEGRTEELNPLYSRGTDYVTHLVEDSSYEIEFSSLTLLNVLGEGAFGKVYKARLNDPKISQGTDLVVAVKMLKELFDTHEKKSLFMEIEFMKQLGSHPHIVSFIGCCKKDTVCLLMDYCRLGDLRSFLLRNRHRQQADYRTYRLNSEVDSGLNSSAESASSSQPHSELHQSRLLSYARQISLAMEYMASKKFIHRDLAARNILMCDEERLKVSDFGLTRDIYERNLYQPTSARRLPYKWMAIEAIFDQVFTIKSDVWSFGIVLWEIVTLGGSPYPGIPNKDLFNLLKEGYRMEKPENCSLEVYQLMLSVWHPNPYCRPSFTELRKKLEGMLEQTKPYINLSVPISNDYYESSSFSDNSDRGSLHHHDNDQIAYVEMSTKDSILPYETPSK